MPHIAPFMTKLGTLTASPWAFLIVLVYVALWIALEGIDWHGFATVATWIMTLLIQRSEHRDTQAIHAKLDELLAAVDHANPDLAHIDEAEPEEVERHRDRARND